MADNQEILSKEQTMKSESRGKSAQEVVVRMLNEFYGVMGNPPTVTGSLNAMALDLLSEASIEQIGGALRRCRRECEFPVRLPHIFARVAKESDGRPGIEEAWARMPKGDHLEEHSVVWCEEERAAFGACRSLLLDGDKIGARMAFKERYERELATARAQRRPVQWSMSAGYNVEHRISVLASAVQEKRMSLDGALNFIPGERHPDFVRMLPAGTAKGLLAGKVSKPLHLPGLGGVLAKLKMDGDLPEALKTVEKKKARVGHDKTTPEQIRERRSLLQQQAVELVKLRRKKK